ncbi:hypothetical protein G3A56_07425 [Rhizobium oryzihabitans]|uniref:Uncharacterized protein n=1 Tax=Rhizobium oryzihabitans TaxID=2267833 RepID=A0A7L5BG92_9HYPH|nr:hypothetical protein [Rhizobium oryzihabitans]QIB37845.1 hypothetical protein G3A56_07425 [Rhizobium oryzihabitans]
MSEVWFDNGTDWDPKNLIICEDIADEYGSIDIDIRYPGLVPANAKSLILTVERGFTALPTSGTGCVSLRVMPSRYNLNRVLDRAKTQEWVVDEIGVDVVADDVRMPIAQGRRNFFYALQSSCPTELNKMMIIDLWGYTL